MPTLGTITASIPNVEDCPALTRMKIFVTQLGIKPTLEHTFRDAAGNPIDLSELFPGAAGGNDSVSESQADEGAVWLRTKELVAPVNSSTNPLLSTQGTVISAAGGTARFPTLATMVRNSGIYQLSFAVVDAENEIKVVNAGLLWVERSLFGSDDETHNLGPPTVLELRQAVLDTGGVDNLLLDDIEFGDDVLATAIGRPLQFWNSRPPPIRPQIDTRNFPFRENWLRAICGHLYEIAAANYRRNHLPYNAGGVAVDDKKKEEPYLRVGAMLLDEWRQFVDYKKLEINQQLCIGSVSSSYGGVFF